MEERGAAAACQAFGFGAVCLAFLAGAALGAVVTPLLGNAALWVADLLLGAGMVLFLIELQPPEPQPRTALARIGPRVWRPAPPGGLSCLARRRAAVTLHQT